MLEEELLKWANGSHDAFKYWKNELAGPPHFITDLQTLKKRARNEDSWNELCAAVSGGLREELRDWFKRTFPDSKTSL